VEIAEAFGGAFRAEFEEPDEVRSAGAGPWWVGIFDKAKVEVVNVDGAEIGRYTMQPGFVWTDDLGMAARAEWCTAPHFQYHAAEVLRLRLADGTDFDARPGTVVALPSPHVGWVVGDEPAVVIDWWGVLQFAT
jgi:hypothetical protein